MQEPARKAPEAPLPAAPAPVDPRAWWVLTAVGLGTFMSALDGSVVNIALPDMIASLRSSVPVMSWVVVVYLLVMAGTVLVFGRLGDLRGYKRTYVAGFAFFAVSSAVCGLSRDVAVLIAFRAIQAVGAAMLTAASPPILTQAFPPQRRGRVLGLQATFTYLGLTVGAPLGGLLTTRFGWPAIFFVNVPIGLVAILLSWRFIESDAGSGDGERFDFPGAALFLVGLVALMLALDEGSTWGWASPAVLALLAVAALLLVAFVMLERRRRSPMLDLSLFRHGVFTTSAAAALMNYVAVYTVVFLMPQYLETGRGLTAEGAGVLIMVQSAVMMVAAPLAGSLSDRIGTRKLVVAGMVLLAGGLAWLGLLGPAAPFAIVGAALGVVGLGTGVFISPNTSALLGSAPPHRRGIASGVLAEARNVGMVLGVGAAGAVYTTFLGGREAGANPATFHALAAAFFMAAAVAALGAVVAATGRREA